MKKAQWMAKMTNKTTREAWAIMSLMTYKKRRLGASESRKEYMARKGRVRLRR